MRQFIRWFGMHHFAELGATRPHKKAIAVMAMAV